MLVAVVIGSVVLRTRGHAFVIITIALLLPAQIVATNWSRSPTAPTGSRWSCRSGPDFQNMPFYYAFLALLVLTVLFRGGSAAPSSASA